MQGFYFLLVVSYFLGSIPTALIAGRILGGIDIRTVGSGNAGATNLYRIFGLKPYLVVLAADFLKGYCATELLPRLAMDEGLDHLHLSIALGLAAVAGHIFTIFAGFKGGKGVATAAGMMFSIAPGPLLAAIAVYLIILAFTSYVSLSSLGAAVSIPLFLTGWRYLLNREIRPEIYGISLVLAAVIIISHRTNIRRLLNGEETKTRFFGSGGKKE